MTHHYPFAAIVGQEPLKRALLLCAIDPTLGGVLIRGDKGTAKSTAARGLTDVLPPITRVAGCAFNCAPDAPLAECEACRAGDAAHASAPVPFVNLPLGATEDRVLGHLDIERALKDGRKAFQPGLLASAHRGLLYIDEVNLLADHLVDVLLDVSAMGHNTVERDGLAMRHPARITLLGTMNLEEGDLRPQLLDRFGMMVEVAAPRDAAVRTEVVRRRLAFEADPAGFVAAWQADTDALRARLAAAQAMLARVALPDTLFAFISTLCCEFEVASLRADIVMHKAARALAALDGRTEVTAEDVRDAAEPGPAAPAAPQAVRAVRPGPRAAGRADAASHAAAACKPRHRPRHRNGHHPTRRRRRRDRPRRRRRRTGLRRRPGRHGRPHRSDCTASARGRRPAQPGHRHAARPRHRRGAERSPVPAGGGRDPAPRAAARSGRLQRDPRRSARKSPRRPPGQPDPAGGGRLRLDGRAPPHGDGQGQRARPAAGRLPAPRSGGADLLPRRAGRAWCCRPRARSSLAERALAALPTGGRTPLAHALQLAAQTLAQAGDLTPLLVVISDGRANIALDAGQDPWRETLALAEHLAARGTPALVLDTEQDYVRLGRARELAQALQADCLPLDHLSGEQLMLTIRERVPG